MAIRLLMKRSVVAALLILAFVLQGTTSVLAGTTGTINGVVVDASSKQPIAGITVTASSPSQNATTTSDGVGRYTFLSLNPDTYTITALANAKYDQSSVSGISVFADATQTVTVETPAKLKVIGTVTSRAASSLVKPGTTADVYSISSAQQDKVAAVGGGGNLNSAWSALATVPGVYIAPNQSGYIGAGSTLSIRGGDYDQVGYELDGVPVNRAFDNYPSGPASSLGQQELQVYTGANPANSEAQGISGYINQVIRTGTFPASKNVVLAIGSPTLYNKGSFEYSGANPTRSMSYYFGAGAYNQDFRYFDNSNGTSLVNFAGGPLVGCPGIAPGITPVSVPTCFSPSGADYTNGGRTPAYVLGPFQLNLTSGLKVRDTVANLHFAIPTKGGNKDDVQLLYDNNNISTSYYTSTNEQGGANYLNLVGVGVPSWTDAYQYSGPTGGAFTPANAAQVTRYLYPDSPVGRMLGNTCGANTDAAGNPILTSGCIPVNQQDAIQNAQGILKLQYQKNFGTTAFLRGYVYTYYSHWMQSDPQTTYFNFLGPGSPDYELSSHTRGVSLSFSDQLNSQHLLTLQGNYTTSSTTRDNNTQMLNGGGLGSRSYFAVQTDSTLGGDGLCYTPAGVATTCLLGGGAQFYTYRDAFRGLIPAVAPGGTCGTTACQLLIVGDGLAATYNRVKPKFSSFSITDQWKPTDRLNINVGLRFDRFEFDGSDTTGGPGGGSVRAFWYKAFNMDTCLDANNNLLDKVTALGLTPTSACPAGTTAANMVNPGGTVIEAYNELQPRVGATYTIDPRTVIRASYGRYVQAPNSAFQQYDALQTNAPFLLYNTYGFQRFGFFSPDHSVRPPASNNYDFSFEHQFPGDVAVKLTPFLRKTQDQIQQFYLNQQTNFVSGLNVGKQTSQGFELEVDKGDFSRNGLAGKLSFTYTNSYINYTRTASGLSVIDPINNGIKAYNAYTGFCAAHPTDARCGTVQNPQGAAVSGPAPCYTQGGAADNTCAAGSIANPYWNAPVQALFDPNGSYPTFDLFPAGIGTSYQTFGAPYVTTLIVQYKKGPLSISPALQFIAGQKYGAPLAWGGIAPDACSGPGIGATIDPNRYPYGAAGGSAFNASNCGGNALAIPNAYTGRFDGLGAFVAPSNLLLHTQITYDVNKRITLVGNFANIVNRCFGGTSVAWSRSNACNYTTGIAGIPPVGNSFNPGDAIQPYVQYPYFPQFPQTPFNMYFEAKIKL